MKILFVTNDLNLINGVCKFTCDWANFFTDKSHKVQIISLCSDSTNLFFNISKHVEVIHLGNELKFVRGHPSFSSQLKIAKAINNTGSDTVIINSMLIYRSLPFIRIKKILIEHIPIESIPRSIMAQKVFYYPFYSQLVCVSTSSYEFYKSKNLNKALYIPNAIFRASSKTTSFGLNCCAVGRFVFWKNFPFIVKAFRKVRDAVPDAKLNLYGGDDYESHDKKIIENLINKYNMQSYVKLHGFASDVESCLLKNSLFLFASNNREAFGITLLEAMAAGLPVVATDSNTIKNLSEGGGILVTDFDEDKFAKAIIDMLINEEKFRHVSFDARQNSLNYLPESIYKKWLSILC